MSSGGQQPVTQQTTQTKDPWSAAQPYLQNAMSSAGALYNSNSGYQPYTGQTQAALEPLVNQASGYTQNIFNDDIAHGGGPGTLAARAAGIESLQNQGLNPGLQDIIGKMGTTGNMYGDVYSEASGQQNPYLLDQLAAQDRRIGDRLNSSMSGAGRYGSGAHTDVMSRALAEASYPVLAADYAQRQQTRLGALQGLTGTQQNIGNIYNQGLQRMGQWGQLMPGLDAARLAPAEGLMTLGQYYQDRSQAGLNDQIKQYNAQQAYPWENLARFNAIVGGAGGLGGTAVTSSPIQQPTTMQKLLGGGLAGAGIGASFGGAPGAAVGALGGGLLGML